MKADRRAVVDTNVLISAALSGGSAPAQLLHHLLAQGRLVFCEETFSELETRLWRPKFDRYLSLERRRELLHDLRAAGEWLTLPSAPLQTYSRDPDDDKFIHLALTARADWLISGDQDLLVLVPLPGVDILTPADALQQIQFQLRAAQGAGQAARGLALLDKAAGQGEAES
ncbi:MAG TPA: putative toxin-antitoxin system toxin component, PIN family [Burkholderiaceae bacterium]|nr:putative toxin-antitoxin system toxin component, PIN family [Burkholderiaceae bacterium]